MNKIITISAVVLSCGICTKTAQAIENNYRPYLAVGYTYADTYQKAAHSYNNAATINLGSVYNPYFGTELFYQYSDKHKFHNQNELKNTQFQAYGLDMMGYLPLGCEQRFAPTITAGIGEYTFEHHYNNSSKNKDHGWGYRFGGGITYLLNDNWGLRAIARYIKLDGVKKTDHMNEYLFSIRYTFN